MSAGHKGLILAAIHVALVLGLAAKFLYGRATRPGVWVLAEAYDPDLPIRGRYLSERLGMPAGGFSYKKSSQPNANDWFLNREWALPAQRPPRPIRMGIKKHAVLAPRLPE
jgi:hypothetical protein